jgi:tetratricopeptide (TPR) repeat protein
MKKIIFLFSVLFISQFCFAANDYQAQINNAEENFKTGNFALAASIYESLISVEKINNPSVYYNLSNAYYRNGNLGKAILNIEKAYRLTPRDGDIKNNRKYLKTLAGQKDGGFIKNFLYGTFSLNELTTVSAGLLIIVFIILSVSAGKSIETVSKFVPLLSLLFFLFFAWTIYRVNVEILTNSAVVLKSSSVRSGPGENNPEIFDVREGAETAIISENSNWSSISVDKDGETLTGWIENKDLGKIKG